MNNILFICMGNICRSPSAEGFFRHHLEGQSPGHSGRIDSAGTHGYHVGAAPDPRAISAASVHGVDISTFSARRVQAEDFDAFDLIIAMDQGNLEALEALRDRAGAGQGARIALMMDYARRYPEVREVPDPYYGSPRDFEYMCELLDDACLGLARAVADSADGDPLGAGEG